MKLLFLTGFVSRPGREAYKEEAHPTGVRPSTHGCYSIAAKFVVGKQKALRRRACSISLRNACDRGSVPCTVSIPECSLWVGSSVGRAAAF